MCCWQGKVVPTDICKKVKSPCGMLQEISRKTIQETILFTTLFITCIQDCLYLNASPDRLFSKLSKPVELVVPSYFLGLLPKIHRKQFFDHNFCLFTIGQPTRQFYNCCLFSFTMIQFLQFIIAIFIEHKGVCIQLEYFFLSTSMELLFLVLA